VTSASRLGHDLGTSCGMGRCQLGSNAVNWMVPIPRFGLRTPLTATGGQGAPHAMSDRGGLQCFSAVPESPADASQYCGKPPCPMKRMLRIRRTIHSGTTHRAARQRHPRHGTPCRRSLARPGHIPRHVLQHFAAFCGMGGLLAPRPSHLLIHVLGVLAIGQAVRLQLD
jgi:hypothetical protein